MIISKWLQNLNALGRFLRDLMVCDVENIVEIDTLKESGSLMRELIDSNGMTNN